MLSHLINWRSIIVILSSLHSLLHSYFCDHYYFGVAVELQINSLIQRVHINRPYCKVRHLG